MVHYALRLSLVVPLLCFAPSLTCAAAAAAAASATCHSVVLFLFLIALAHRHVMDDLQRPICNEKHELASILMLVVCYKCVIVQCAAYVWET